MKFSGVFPRRENQKRTEPAYDPAVHDGMSGEKRSKISQVFSVIWGVIFRLRKVVMAIPVVYFALKLASYNTDHLPLVVGIDLQSTGEFAHVISRQTAVMVPLGITGACLLLMFLSRKSTYPWLISIFSLVIPILLLIVNCYPM